PGADGGRPHRRRLARRRTTRGMWLESGPILGAVALTALAVMSLAISACANNSSNSPSSNSSSGGGGIKKGLKIAFLPKQVNNAYFTTSDNGGKAAVAEFGGVYSETGPSDASASAQVSYINTLSQQGTNVLV